MFLDSYSYFADFIKSIHDAKTFVDTGCRDYEELAKEDYINGEIYELEYFIDWEKLAKYRYMDNPNYIETESGIFARY